MRKYATLLNATVKQQFSGRQIGHDG